MPAMRWEKLFAELEAQADDLELDERDLLVDELRDGDWAETSWHSLLGGQVVLDVMGAGRVEGQAVLVNERLVQLRGDRVDHVVAHHAVLTILSTQERSAALTRVTAALGWGHVFRALRGAGETIGLRLVDGTSRDGSVDVVGKDFVRLRSESGREIAVPFAAVAVVSGRT